MKWNDVSDVVLVSLLLTLNIFHGLSWCFLCFRTSKYRLGIHLNNQVFWGLTTNSLIKNTYWLFFFRQTDFWKFLILHKCSHSRPNARTFRANTEFKFTSYSTEDSQVKNIIHRFSCVLNPSRPNPGRREKISLKLFIFILLCVASKDFMKAFKAFIKPFETPQRSVKIKI